MDNQLEFDSHYAILECSFIFDDPRLDALTPTQRWLYIVLWCRAVQLKQETIPYHGLPNANASIARLSRIDPRSVASAISKLQQLCLINVTKMGDITVCGVKTKHPKLKWKTVKGESKKGKITPIYNTDTDTKKEDKEDKYKEDIQKVYDFYIKHSKRNPKLYSLTKLRKTKIKARLKDGFSLKEMGEAVYGILDNEYMVKHNIIDIEAHLFGSREKTERWIREFTEEKK